MCKKCSKTNNLGDKMQNRELYDLCRKYKYAFKKHNEINKLNKDFWSEHIIEAHKEALIELKEAEWEIIKYIFMKYIDFSTIESEMSRDVGYGYSIPNSTYPIPGTESYKTTIFDKEFYDICSRILMEKGVLK